MARKDLAQFRLAASLPFGPWPVGFHVGEQVTQVASGVGVAPSSLAQYRLATSLTSGALDSARRTLEPSSRGVVAVYSHLPGEARFPDVAVGTLGPARLPDHW